MIAKIRANPVLAWGVLFLALALLRTEYGGQNAMSRTALLRAITEKHTLRIDDYRDWTIDWALAPDGHLYSNKPPGPALLGLPVFALYDALFVLPPKNPDSLGRAPQPGYAEHILLVLWLQLIPFFLLVLRAARLLVARGAPLPAVHFFALAAFFGNTAALYMNVNFGHGLAAILFLAAFLSWWEERYLLAGAFVSWSMLCDYGVAFTLPFVLLASVWRERSLKPALAIALGALPGAAVWCWYHVACFGSPFRTANQFINPEQIEKVPGSLWGAYSPVPFPGIVGKLLFGSSRGILFTQPWMLAVFALPFLKVTRGLAFFAAGALLGVLWMNGGFGGWHGGWCLGPRYMAAVFPAAALAMAISWEKLPPRARPALWAALGVALVFRLLVFPFSSLAPEENLWAYHLRLYADPAHRGTTLLRLGLALLCAGLALWRQHRRREFPFSPKSV